MTEDMQEFSRQVDTLRRQGTERHSWMVYGLVRWLQPKVIVETGTYDGYVTAHIALAMIHNGFGKLYTIDNGEYLDSPTPEQIWKNLSKCGIVGSVGLADVSIVHKESLKWEWPEKVDLAILDGDRTAPNFFEEVRRVVKAGAECFTLHDTHHDGVACQYYREFKEKMTDWEVINAGFRGGFAVFLKKQRGEPTDLTDWVPPSSLEVNVELP